MLLVSGINSTSWRWTAFRYAVTPKELHLTLGKITICSPMRTFQHILLPGCVLEWDLNILQEAGVTLLQQALALHCTDPDALRLPSCGTHVCWVTKPV